MVARLRPPAGLLLRTSRPVPGMTRHAEDCLPWNEPINHPHERGTVEEHPVINILFVDDEPDVLEGLR